MDGEFEISKKVVKDGKIEIDYKLFVKKDKPIHESSNEKVESLQRMLMQI